MLTQICLSFSRIGDVSSRRQAFLDFVLSHYVSVGVQELDQDKLTPLLKLKYHDSIADALADLGRPEEIGKWWNEDAGDGRYAKGKSL